MASSSHFYGEKGQQPRYGFIPQHHPPATPTTDEDGAMPPSYDHHSSDHPQPAAPPLDDKSRAPDVSASKRTQAVVAPVPSPFALPPAPADAPEFHFKDDAASTIYPDDSVSQQLGRRTTERRVGGPRPLAAAAGAAAGAGAGGALAVPRGSGSQHVMTTMPATMQEPVDRAFSWVQPSAIPHDDLADADANVVHVDVQAERTPRARSPLHSARLQPRHHHQQEQYRRAPVAAAAAAAAATPPALRSRSGSDGAPLVCNAVPPAGSDAAKDDADARCAAAGRVAPYDPSPPSPVAAYENGASSSGAPRPYVAPYLAPYDARAAGGGDDDDGEDARDLRDDDREAQRRYDDDDDGDRRIGTLAFRNISRGISGTIRRGWDAVAAAGGGTAAAVAAARGTRYRSPGDAAQARHDSHEASEEEEAERAGATMRMTAIHGASKTRSRSSSFTLLNSSRSNDYDVDGRDKYAAQLESGSAGATALPTLLDSRSPRTAQATPQQQQLLQPRSDVPVWRRWFWDTTPTHVRVAEHKRGQGVQRRAWACHAIALACVVALVVELVRMAQLTGSPIQTKPSFNVMLGPSGSVLIHLGARFAACQKFIDGVSDIAWVCLEYSNQATVSADELTCDMADICGFGGFPQDSPDQSFRYFTAIWIHAGIVHLVINLFALWASSAHVERMMGTPKFLVTFLAAGIFGFVLGSNFALVGQPSVGASGAIFGCHMALLVDLVAHWKIEVRPVRKLAWLVLELLVAIALGLIPGLDNFAHLGGMAIGLFLSMAFIPIITFSRKHLVVVSSLRVVGLVLAIVFFAVFTTNFYKNDPTEMCSWCRYLSCIPTDANNQCQGTGLQTVKSVVSALVVPLLSILFI